MDDVNNPLKGSASAHGTCYRPHEASAHLKIA